jgi:hypothetical protein
MDLSAERVAKNDMAFRDANEGIGQAAAEHGIAERVPFICECADPGCTQILQLSLAEYEMIRMNPRRFLHAVGHHTGEHEMVVEEKPGYAIVEKVGRAGEVVEEIDADVPRS